MDISQTISKLTTDVWENIKHANALKINFGEETISDVLLLELARLKNCNLRIIQTPKHLEKNKGTDWEWFIGSQSYGWFRFAIQAKKGKPKTGKYANLGHKVNGKLQKEILEDYAKVNNAVPLYSFYNYYPKATKGDHWHCNKTYNQELLGWTFTTLKIVEAALANRGQKNFNFIHTKRITLPIVCLFDCPILLRKYQDKSLINQKIRIFDAEVTKIKSLPSSLIEKRDIISINTFPKELYNKEIELYPRRIAIFDLKPKESDS